MYSQCEEYYAEKFEIEEVAMMKTITAEITLFLGMWVYTFQWHNYYALNQSIIIIIITHSIVIVWGMRSMDHFLEEVATSSFSWQIVY